VTILSDRRVYGPWGLEGGAAGSGGAASVMSGETIRELPAKTHLEIQPGERLHIETPGGGGWGASDISGKMSDR